MGTYDKFFESMGEGPAGAPSVTSLPEPRESTPSDGGFFAAVPPTAPAAAPAAPPAPGAQWSPPAPAAQWTPPSPTAPAAQWPPPAPAGGWAPTPFGYAPSTPSRRAPSLKWLGLLAAIPTFFGVRYAISDLLTKPLHAPAAIAGIPRNDTPEVRSTLADQERKLRDNAGNDGVAALYGATTAPRFLLIAGRGRERNAREMWSGFSRGFLTTAPAGTQLGEPQPVGKDLLCARVQSTVLGGSVCVWGGKSDGSLFDFRSADIAATARVTATVRADLTR
ncbi:MAG: hypothetical protein ABR520_07300 [Mycobacteriales bacterium]|nr:hypothetical protein [Frankia sp.]